MMVVAAFQHGVPAPFAVLDGVVSGDLSQPPVVFFTEEISPVVLAPVEPG